MMRVRDVCSEGHKALEGVYDGSVCLWLSLFIDMATIDFQFAIFLKRRTLYILE